MSERDDSEHWEKFCCERCGYDVWRLRGSFDMPVCAECRWWDEIDPDGKLRKRRRS